MEKRTLDGHKINGRRTAIIAAQKHANEDPSTCTGVLVYWYDINEVRTGHLMLHPLKVNQKIVNSSLYTIELDCIQYIHIH